MLRLAQFSIRRPWVTLAVAAVIAVALSLIGYGISDRLSPTRTFVPGTESSRAQTLARTQFGPTTLVPIMLQGPRAQLDRQGPALVRALLARPKTRVLSAWDTGSASASLRPRPTAAMIVVSVDKSLKAVFKTDQQQIENTVHRVIATPVHAHITGQAALDQAIKNESIHITRRAMWIAVGILFVLLLLGLRAPVAALLISIFGAVTVLSSAGALTLWAHFVETEPIALPLGTVVGLAFGTGFSLLMMDRFREEELGAGGRQANAEAAAAHTIATAGRSVLLAGTAIIVALTVTGLIGPSINLFAVGTGAVICAAIGAGLAVLVMPSALTVLGPRIDKWSFAAPAFASRAWDRLVGMGGFVTSRAVGMGAVATALLAALAIPAFALDTGPPDVKQLPSDSQQRKDYEAISRVMGPGWASPFNVVVVSKNGAVTSASTLAAMDRFQRTIARDPEVVSVVGPGQLATQTKQLGKLPASLQSSAKLVKGGKKDLARLSAGMTAATAGALQLQSGLSSAATGAGKLTKGSGSAQSGATTLSHYLAQARAGSATLASGLSEAQAGAQALSKGANQALAGSTKLTKGIGSAATPVKAGVPTVNALAAGLKENSAAVSSAANTSKATTQQIDAAISSLQGCSACTSDPSYSATLGSLQQARSSSASVESALAAVSPKLASNAVIAGAVAGQVSALSGGLAQLYTGSSQLEAGIAQLQKGNAQLAGGMSRLSGGGSQLTSALGQLYGGSTSLATGLGKLTAGNAQLQSGLTSGVSPAGQLASGLGLMSAGVTKFRGQLPSTKDLEQLQAQAPGLFDSSYFVLAAVEGATPSNRNAAGFMINLQRGGTAGQIVVVSRDPTSNHATTALGGRLKTLTAQFARKNRLEAAVGGPAGELGDFASETRSRIPWVCVGLAVAMFLMLALSLRAILLPLVATVFAGLSAAAATGVLALLITGHDPVLGGPGYIDSMSLIETIGSLTGIALAYMVVLLTRAREEYLATGDAHTGLRTAMRHTDAVAVGMAAATVAAVIPFLSSGLMNVRYTIALAVLALLQAFVVVPVLLPAAMELMGRWSWWPTWVGSDRPHHLPRPHLPGHRHQPRQTA